MTSFDDDLCAQPAERHYVLGDTRTGKSCHVDHEMRAIQRLRPECMNLLVDSKPRFRAETERMPLNPKGRVKCDWRYRHWQKGPVVPGSVLVDLHSEHPFRGLWARPGEIAILQSGDGEEWRRMLTLLMAFVKAQVGSRERHITADEVLDFYGRTTFSIKSDSDVFYLAARAGGERNIGMTLGSQYVNGLPPLVRKMWSRITLYHLGSDAEMKYLNALGIPEHVSPEGDYVFNQWRKQPGGAVSPTFTGTLQYPDSYLQQLASV